MLTANYHTHSTFCDGANTPNEIVTEALKLGMTHLGFSGHMDVGVYMKFEDYLTEIRKLQREYREHIEILCGVELDNLYDPKYSEKVDYVIGSTHYLDVDSEMPFSVDYKPEEVVRLCKEFFEGDYYKLCKSYYELEAKIIDRFPCTFIGHFDLVTKFNYVLHFVDETDTRYLAPAYEAMDYLVSKGVMFEINTGQSLRGKLYPSIPLLRRLKEIGGEIIINSDAHKAADLMKKFDMAVQIAKECGFNHTNYLTMKRGKRETIQIGI